MDASLGRKGSWHNAMNHIGLVKRSGLQPSRPSLPQTRSWSPENAAFHGVAHVDTLANRSPPAEKPRITESAA